MNEQEAKDIALKVLANVDGGCNTCITGVCEDMAKLYPEYPWLLWIIEDEERRVEEPHA